MTWENAKATLLKGMAGLFIAWCAWSMKQSVQASSQLRDAVSDLKAIIWELRESTKTTREQVSNLATRTDAQLLSLSNRTDAQLLALSNRLDRQEARR